MRSAIGEDSHQIWRSRSFADILHHRAAATNDRLWHEAADFRAATIRPLSEVNPEVRRATPRTAACVQRSG
jgi:hypothetical protein